VTYSRDERLALAALLEETGPDAPTLCAGWRTRDLAAHVVLRERRPDAAAGVMGGPLAGYTARVQRRYLDMYTYPQLIELFRAGPPRLSPFAIPGADELANVVEYFIHHEDVRRATPGWTERELPAGLSDVLRERLKGMQLIVRSAPTGVVLVPEGGAATVQIIAKNTAPSVTVTGTPAELIMWSAGRVSAANVRFVDGPAESVARLAAWRQ